MSDVTDMGTVIIPKSDQINADDLLAGPITIMVEKVSIRPGTEQPVSIHFAGDGGKPYKPCKSMARVMVHCWGPDANKYVGRSMTLYCDPKVKWGGMAVGGIRISHMTDIEAVKTMALTETKGSRKPFTVHPLVIAKADPKPDKAGDGARALIERIRGAKTGAELFALVDDKEITKQRAWLKDKRPELAADVEEAFVAAQSVVSAPPAAESRTAGPDSTEALP